MKTFSMLSIPLSNRRAFLGEAGSLLAVVASPIRAASAEEKSAPIIDTLSIYMANAASQALSPDAIEHTKHHILDTFAAMISGSTLPPGKLAIALARAQMGQSLATVAGCDVVCGPIEAAMANGMLAHSDETDDSHAPSHSHPGCSIVPAALASGEYFKIDGTRFLRAVALGYDVGPRVTMALGGLSFQMRTHFSAHGIAANFGAAAAAGCAAGLDAHQMRFVLDYAAQQASGVAAWQRDTQHMEKALVFAGFPARNGVSAALIVQRGGTGVDDIFSGADNFLMAFSSQADPDVLVDQLGERFEVSRTNIKKWTVGSPIQAPLDALELIRNRQPFDTDQVQRVIVRVATSEAKTVNNRDMPDICLQHIMAVMLHDKTVSFDAAHDRARMQDPAILRERAKIQLMPDEELERLYPRREAIVDVVLADGTTLSERVRAVRGTADNPMTREEVIAKSRDLLMPVVGAIQANRLIDTVLTLENLRDLRTLRPLLRRAVG